MNDLYNTDLPLSMRLSGVTVNTPEEYQNLLNALYKNSFADPAYVQQLRQKYLSGDAPPAAGGVGDPAYEQAQAQSWKDYVQKKLGEFGVQNFQTPQAAEQQEAPQAVDPLTYNSLTPNTWNPFTGYGVANQPTLKENVDLETVQNVDQDQVKEEASQDFLGDYIASADWPSGPGSKPEPPVIPSTDPQRWPMIPGGPSRPGPAGTGANYPLAGIQDDTLIAATYPRDPKWMREIDKMYKETKNKPYSPGDPLNDDGMRDTWSGPPVPKASRQDEIYQQAIAKALPRSDEKRQLETFQSEYDPQKTKETFDPQKAREAVQAASNYRVGSSNSDPFRQSAFA